MDKVQGQEDEFINPDIEVFISYFENLNIDSEFDIYEEYTSENYGNIDVSLTLEDPISQSQSISQEETVAEPNQQQTSTQQSIDHKRVLPTQSKKVNCTGINLFF